MEWWYKCRYLTVTILFVGLTLSATVNDNDFNKKPPWTGLWFPENPENAPKNQSVLSDRKETTLTQNENTLQTVESKTKDNLPSQNQSPVPNDDPLQMADSRLHGGLSPFQDDWKGKWFPAPPGQPIPLTSENNGTKMGISDGICDDGMTNLKLDYDPHNITHHNRHLCIDDRKLFAPNYDLNPRLLDYTIPPEYVARHECMNDEIKYDDDIPTFGTHRKLWPVYGEYVYVPPQRWIHSLEHGAIVLLYDPCANLVQLDIVRNLVKKCLFRHVITPYDKLTPERPFALVAWGRSFEFSVVDQLAVVSFIRLYGLQGPEPIYSNGQYNQTLIEPAKIVTSPEDSILCQNL